MDRYIPLPSRALTLLRRQWDQQARVPRTDDTR
jgi:hypothetical protein